MRREKRVKITEMRVIFTALFLLLMLMGGEAKDKKAFD